MEQVVRRAGELEGLHVRQPGEQQVPSLGKRRSADLADDCEHGLSDMPRIRFRERPALPECGQLLREERVRVGDGLLEGAREVSLERLTVVGTEDAAEECVDGTFLVSGAVTLDCGLYKLAAEGGLQLGR
jgi:hypothetical protein